MKAVAILLGFTLLCPGWASKQTTQVNDNLKPGASPLTSQIGLTTGERSWSVRVPLNDCHDLDEEYANVLYGGRELTDLGKSPLCFYRRNAWRLRMSLGIVWNNKRPDLILQRPIMHRDGHSTDAR